MEERVAILKSMRICRFCLTEQEPLTCIYDKDLRSNKLSIPLPLQVMACVSIEVFPNDGMPQMICSMCRQQTIISYRFKSNCKQADDALKLYLATGTLRKPNALEGGPTETVYSDPLPTVPEQTPQTSKKIRIRQPKEFTEEDPLHLDNPQNEELNEPENQTPVSQIEEGEVVPPEYIEQDYLDENREENTKEEEEEYEEYQNQANDKFKPTNILPDVPVNVFSCNRCERSFPLQQLLEIHLQNHDRDRNFNCHACDKMFFTKYDLAKHAAVHSEEKPFKCIACPKSFARATILHRHEKIHVELPKYLCTHCDKTFLVKDELNRHELIHKKNRPFRCDRCDKSFAFKQGLDRHQELHKTDKPHRCNYCTESFDTSGKLARHVTAHAGIRPYPCKFCHRSFLLSHHLTRHMRGHEENSFGKSESSENYKCSECSMKFKRKDGLIGHSTIHSMVSLKCIFCNKQFEGIDSIQDHVKTHMHGRIYPCLKCNLSFMTQKHLDDHEAQQCDNGDNTNEYESFMENSNPGPEEEINIFNDPETGLEDDGIQIKQDLDDDKVRRSSRKTKITDYAQFIKDELGSEESENDESLEDVDEFTVTAGSSKKPSPKKILEESIKPIQKQEGTKTYSPRNAKKPTGKLVENSQGTIELDPEPETQAAKEAPAVTTIDLPVKNITKGEITEMKIGDKMVKVQKLIMSKAEVEEMARQGKIKMKDGAMLLKQPYDTVFKKPFDSTKLPTPITSSQKSKPPAILKRVLKEESVEGEPEPKKFVRTYKKKYTSFLPGASSTPVKSISSQIESVSQGSQDSQVVDLEPGVSIDAPSAESTETLQE